MSKTKNRERSEVEYFRGQVRKLESENRQLKRRIKALDRRAHFYEEVVDEVVEDVEVKKACPNCGKGILQELDFKHVVVTKCNHCTYQKTRKPRANEKKDD